MASRTESLTPSLIAIIEPDGLILDWESDGSVPASTVEQELMDAFHANPHAALFNWGFHREGVGFSDSLDFVVNLSRTFVAELARTNDLEVLRHRTEVELSEDIRQQILDSVPFLIGGEHVNSDWLGLMWTRLNRVFQEQIAAYPGTVEEFFAAHHAAVRPLGRVYFHLVENKHGEAPFAFLATYGPAPGQAVRHVPLKNALIEYQSDRRQLLDLLSTVTQAAQHSAFVAGLVDSGEIFQPLRLTAAEAYTFLKEVPLYESAGILCRIPKWWRSAENRMRVTVKMGDTFSRVGTRAILDFEAKIALGGEHLTADEVRQLLSETEGLAYIKGKWVEVDHEKLKKILAAYEAAQKRQGSLSIIDALRFELYRGGDVTDQDWETVEISHGQWLHDLLHTLREPGARPSVEFGGELSATLRPYQTRGVQWLADMRRWGLGACLADDMGLGKTLQVLALLTALRQQGRIRAVLVVPASLLGNWIDEMHKFTPHLTARVAHPSAMSADELTNPEWLNETEVVLTTYGLVQRYDWIREADWDVAILDEAQAIKNPDTKQARAVKSLRAAFRVALTGTPIENRLSDLWSLFDFLNRGLLGTSTEFAQYAKALHQHPQGYAPLRQLAGPFILRRLKTDKSVISDLPDKIEVTTRATLTRRQAALYGEVVADVAQKIETLSGSERRGLILASLMRLKQICNHPDQYLGQVRFEPGESGKFERLGELAEMIYDKRERVLVFTQFREMTQPLAEYLASVFHHSGLVLHGGTPVAQRRGIVGQFQGADYVPFLVLSLKAGGVGLNLTQASHVIHFDRWWNPAVENQATDRAFRIGQTRNVLVHKFVTQGTIEEKIDQLIQDKAKLSQEIIPTMQEKWIGDLDNQALMDLFRLDVRGS